MPHSISVAQRSKRAGRTRRVVRLILLLLGGALCLLSGVLLLGAAIPRLPVIGTIGTFVLTPLAPQFVVIALVGVALTLLAFRLGLRRTGAVLTAVGMVASIGSGLILSSQVRAADAAGARINVLGTFNPQPITAGAPDEVVQYTTVDGTALKMDVYRPHGTARGGGHPVVMYVHGGGWSGGAPEDQAANLRWFADRGYLAVAPQYVLSTSARATWDTAGPQVGCALRWVGDHAAQYGGDPARLFAWGESAGGGLILTAGYAAAQGRAESSCGGSVPTLRAVSAAFPGVDTASIYGNTDAVLGGASRTFVTDYLGGSPASHPARAAAVSPSTFVSDQAPPTLLVLSGDDHLVPIAGALRFSEAARGAGAAVTTVRIPHTDHGSIFILNGVANQTLLQRSLALFEQHGG